jgi:hypothetical protein
MAAHSGSKKPDVDDILFSFSMRSDLSYAKPTSNIVSNYNLNTGWSKGYCKNIIFDEIDPPKGVDAPTVGFEDADTNKNAYWYSYSNYASGQVPGQVMTVSVYVKTARGNCTINCYTADNSESGRVWNGFVPVNESDGWKRVSWTFTIPTNSTSESLSFNFTFSGSTTRMWLCAPQMELGPVATKWTPHGVDRVATGGSDWTKFALKDRFNKRGITLRADTYDSEGNFFFDGTGETDAVPTGTYIEIPSNLCTTNPAVRPEGVTYSWWQYSKDLQRRSIFFGSGTINHIENFPPNFRTEARLRNGHSFGASGANQVANVWENYAIVFDNAVSPPVARWYKNGELFHTGNLTNANSQHDYFEPNALGRATGSASYLYAKSHYGYVDSFFVYNGTLSENKIKRLYESDKEYFNNLTMP